MCLTRLSVRLLRTEDEAEAAVAVKPGSVVQVEAPPPVVIVAYASHNDKPPHDKRRAFMSCQVKLLMPVSPSSLHC
jgi:hypothetical protein